MVLHTLVMTFALGQVDLLLKGGLYLRELRLVIGNFLRSSFSLLLASFVLVEVLIFTSILGQGCLSFSLLFPEDLHLRLELSHSRSNPHGFQCLSKDLR